MNLLELQKTVNQTIARVREDSIDPATIPVTVQIDGPDTESVWSDGEIELCYDGNMCASGCVILGQRDVAPHAGKGAG